MNNGNELDMRMMIHQSQAGCVIGKGGSKIREIREVSFYLLLLISIFHTAPTNIRWAVSNERVVVMDRISRGFFVFLWSCAVRSYCLQISRSDGKPNAQLYRANVWFIPAIQLYCWNT